MAIDPTDQEARRAYWTSQLEESHALLQAVLRSPVEECGERMVPMEEAVSLSGIEVQFSAKKHVLGLDRIYYLREGLMEGFLAAAQAMNRRGWILRVEDGFRTRTMQKHLGLTPAVFDAILKRVAWELGGAIPSPEFFLRRSMTLIALWPKAGTHLSGSAIDISVFEKSTGHEIDRGGPYLEMSERTPMLSPFVSDTARENRAAITAIMREQGFVEYPWEFWHYNSGDVYEQLINKTGKPAQYGPVDWSGPEGNILTPIAHPGEPFNSPEEIHVAIEASLKRWQA